MLKFKVKQLPRGLKCSFALIIDLNECDGKIKSSVWNCKLPQNFFILNGLNNSIVFDNVHYRFIMTADDQALKNDVPYFMDMFRHFDVN